MPENESPNQETSQGAADSTVTNIDRGRAPSGLVLQLVVPILIVAVGAAGYMTLIRAGEANKENETAPSPTTPLVETASVSLHSTGFEIKADGNVVPFREIEVATEVGGRVVFKSPSCRRGHFVKKNMVLLQVDRRDYDLEVERLTQERTQADENIAELDVEIANTRELVKLADEQVQLAGKDLKRLIDLVTRDAATDAQVDQGKVNELSSRNARLVLKHRISVLTARRNRLVAASALAATQLKRAMLDLSRCEIVAPIDGVIINDAVEQDSYVQKGTPLFVIEDTSAVEVLCGLRMEDLVWLGWNADSKPQQPTTNEPDGNRHTSKLPSRPVTISYDMGSQVFFWDGVLDRFDGLGLDQRTRTAPCRIVVKDPYGKCSPLDPGCSANTRRMPLMRGMYVSVQIKTPEVKPLLRIPENALRPGGVIWEIADGQLKLHKVEAVSANGSDVLVKTGSGLTSKSRVVVSPLVSAFSGMAVREAGE
ncbi:MAG: hypothetical protein CMJ78_04180 [Planctomycetaceae bacterium]|nr:hypothetical protein [Planctomycetaceae bacterium]